MHMAIAVMGFSFGLATTLSITIVVDMTTVSARGTTNSLRIMSNRAGQFVLPFGAGLVAAAAGPRRPVPGPRRRHLGVRRRDALEAARA